MSGIILSVNAGSSSLKVSLFAPTADGPKHLATCSVDSINADATASFKSTVKDISEQEKDLTNVRDHDGALQHVLKHLFRTTTSEEDVTHVCHRVVHGGTFKKRVVIDDKSLHHLEALIELAPLHNAASTALIRSTHKQLPKALSIAYFDTTFHSSIPPHIYTFPIDQELTKKYGLRKHGFHGISYSFILRNVTQFLKKPAFVANLIVLHLGSGASVCCIKNGLSLDTSMSLTPLAGLPGATRSGDIDPTAILHLIKVSSTTVDDAETMLNKQSGWKALAGTSSFGDVASNQAKDDVNAKLAFDLFVDRILNFVGAYYLKLEGNVDALVFAGGIGEKSVELRRAVSERCQTLGFSYSEDKNREKGTQDAVVRSISPDLPSGGVGKRILICQTDEQFEMAYQCTEDSELYDRGEL